MFGFLKKIASLRRQKAFTEAISDLKGSDKNVQFAVGYGLNTANSFFFQKFKDVDAFKALPRHEKIDYVKKLGKLENEVGKKDPQAGLGIGLFKMWVVSIVTNDEEATQYYSKELAWLSKVGDMSGT